MTFLLLASVFCLGFAAMFVGAISGGVGLVLRPLLIALGVPAATIVGTARVSGYAGELPGLYVLHRRGRIDWKASSYLVAPMFVGSSLAAWLALSIGETWLRRSLGAGLMATGIMLAANPDFGVREGHAPARPHRGPALAMFGTIAIAFFNTMVGGLGPAFGSFYMWVYGKTYIDGSAMWRVAWYIGAAPASIAFVLGGVVDWPLCAALAGGLTLGSYLGSLYGLKRGQSWVRLVVIVVVFASAVRLLLF